MISPLTTVDLNKVLELENNCFHDAYNELTLKSTFQAPTFYGLKFEDAEFKGYLILSRVLDEANLDRIAVKKEFRNQKIATKLILSAVDELKTSGVSSIFLEVRFDNESAINLYKSLDFKQISIRKNYYGCGIDGLIFKKDL